MKPQILLLALITAVAFSSCTTAYKTGQTPDDVYFSPGQPQDEYVRVERKDNRRYEGTDEYYDDRYLRMKVQNRYRWNDLDEWYYYGNRYNYSYYNYNYWNNPWTPYTYWNCYHNPYYQNTIIVSPKSPVYSGPRRFNLGNYNNNANGTAITNNNYSNPKTAGGTNQPRYNYNNSNSNTDRSNGNTGSFLRNVFNGNNNTSNSSSTNSSSNSSSSSSSSSSSGSSSGSGSSAPVRRF